MTNPLTMKAALLMEYGKPLEIAEVPRPIPKVDEVLVKIEASGVCFTDVHILKGEHASPNPLPLVMGHEGVGRVVALGSEGCGIFVEDLGSINSETYPNSMPYPSAQCQCANAEGVSVCVCVHV